MLKTCLKFAFILFFIGFNAYISESFARDGLRWVKVYNTRLNPNISVSLSTTGLDGNQYSCGDKCQMIQLLTAWNSDHGNLVINLRDLKCGSSYTLNIPFMMDYEELVTPLTTYDVSMSGGYCQQNLKAEVTGSPDFAKQYKVDLIS